jgi:hypothetical protein
MSDSHCEPPPSPESIFSAIEQIPHSNSIFIPWLCWTFTEPICDPLIFLDVLPLLWNSPRFHDLFLAPESVESLVNHFWLLFPATVDCPEKLAPIRLNFFEFISNCVIEGLRNGRAFGRLQYTLFKYPFKTCSIELEYRFFSILRANILQTCDVVVPWHCFLALAQFCFPPSSPIRTLVIRFILQQSPTGFPFWRLATIMETQGLKSHVCLQLFVEVLNRCELKANKSSMITLLNCVADPILGREAVQLIEQELTPAFWMGDVTRVATSRWLTELFHGIGVASGAEQEEICAFIKSIAAVRVQPLAELLRAAADSEVVPWPLTP